MASCSAVYGTSFSSRNLAKLMTPLRCARNRAGSGLCRSCAEWKGKAWCQTGVLVGAAGVCSNAEDRVLGSALTLCIGQHDLRLSNIRRHTVRICHHRASHGQGEYRSAPPSLQVMSRLTPWWRLPLLMGMSKPARLVWHRLYPGKCSAP